MQIAANMGATGIQDLTAPTGTSFATTEAAANLNGQQIDIATFSSTSDRAAWEKIERQSFYVTDNGPSSSSQQLAAVADLGPVN